MSIKESILDFVRSAGGRSCIELCDQVEGFRGDYDWIIGTNTIIWSGVSEDAIKAMNELLNEKEVVGSGASLLVYLVDGGMLKLPLAKSLKTKYKKPHWIPLTFSTYAQIGKAA